INRPLRLAHRTRCRDDTIIAQNATRYQTKGDFSMNTFLRRAAVLSMVTAALVVLVLKGSGPATVAGQQTPQDQKREKIQRLKFQTFRGEAAAFRANQLRVKSKAVK